MDEGDGFFDLDNLEFASQFGAPIAHWTGEAVAMMQGDSLDRARFRCGSRLGLWESRIRVADSRATPGLARLRDPSRALSALAIILHQRSAEGRERLMNISDQTLLT